MSLLRAGLLLFTTLAVAYAAEVQTTPTETYKMNDLLQSDKVFKRLVTKYVSTDGKVDYAAWHTTTEDVLAMNEHIKVLAHISPENHPDWFVDKSATRSYWINAYNSLVIKAVLDLWPLDSVQDVRVSFSSRIIPGKGFFYDRKVIVGGREMNLYNMENDIIRKQLRDPRVHFALNCASGSCPVLRPSDWTEEDLDSATLAFVNDPANVIVKNQAVWLSRIFKWYKKDFPDDLYGYLMHYSQPGLHDQLQAAKNNGYKIHYFEYNWELNGTENPVAQAHHG